MEKKYNAINLGVILAGDNHPLTAYREKVTIYADFMGDVFERIPKDIGEWNFSMEEEAFHFGDQKVYVRPMSDYILKADND